MDGGIDDTDIWFDGWMGGERQVDGDGCIETDEQGIPGSTRLHDLVKLVFLLQDFAARLAHGGEPRIELLIEWLKVVSVLGVGDEPVNAWKVLPLCQLLVEAPKHLHDAQRGARDRVGEIPARRAHGAHDRNASLALRAPEARHPPRPLIERSEAGTQVSRIP